MKSIFLGMGFENFHVRVYEHSSPEYVTAKIIKAVKLSNCGFELCADDDGAMKFIGMPRMINVSCKIKATSDALDRLGKAGIAGAEAGKRFRDELEKEKNNG